MKKLLLPFFAFYSLPLMAQITMEQSKKDQIIDDNIGRLYAGCASGYERSIGKGREQVQKKLRREPVSADEVSLRVKNTKDIVEEYYKESFAKNPSMREMLHKDLDQIAIDKSCQSEGNDCRAKVLATAKFYMDFMRPTNPECEGFDISKLKSKEQDAIKSQLGAAGMNYSNPNLSLAARCELESRMKDKSLQRYSISDVRSRYVEDVTNFANRALMEVSEEVLNKHGMDKKKNELIYQEVHICDPTKSLDSEIYQMPLKIALYQDPYLTVSIGKKQEPKPEPKECIEEKVTLFSEFVPTNFEEGRSTVGKDQIDPVKAKIMNFMSSNPNMIVTDVSVISSSSKTPFTNIVNNKKVIDPKSDEKNLALANQRSGFASQVLDEMKASSSELSKINFSVKSELAGPEFSEEDFNLRKIAAGSAGYTDKVKQLFDSNKDVFATQALRKNPEELLDAKQFPTLYHAKFKPFQGFRITITGYVKEKMKCSDQSSSSGKTSGGKGSASKQ